MNSLMVIAPHPDDETLGCGGLLLKAKAGGARLTWCIASAMTAEGGFTSVQMETRRSEIDAVAARYGFDNVVEMGFPAARLDRVADAELAGAIGAAVRACACSTLLLPYPGDAHTDHRAVFDGAVSATKWFRQPTIRSVMAYETLSETDFGLSPVQAPFRPNLFVDISAHLDRKIEIMGLYRSELGVHPFPRSERAMRAQAVLRGAQAGCEAAEAFMLLKEIR